MCFPNILVKIQMNIWISQTKSPEIEMLINFLCLLLPGILLNDAASSYCQNSSWSEHTCLISSYQLLITAACTNTGGKMKGSHSRAADRCPFVLRHSLSQVFSFMHLRMACSLRVQTSFMNMLKIMLLSAHYRGLSGRKCLLSPGDQV